MSTTVGIEHLTQLETVAAQIAVNDDWTPKRQYSSPPSSARSEFKDAFKRSEGIITGYEKADLNPDQKRALTAVKKRIATAVETMFSHLPMSGMYLEEADKVINSSIFNAKQKGALKKAFQAKLAEDLLAAPEKIIEHFNLREYARTKDTLNIYLNLMVTHFDALFAHNRHKTLSTMAQMLPWVKNQNVRKAVIRKLHEGMPYYSPHPVKGRSNELYHDAILMYASSGDHSEKEADRDAARALFKAYAKKLIFQDVDLVERVAVLNRKEQIPDELREKLRGGNTGVEVIWHMLERDASGAWADESYQQMLKRDAFDVFIDEFDTIAQADIAMALKYAAEISYTIKGRYIMSQLFTDEEKQTLYNRLQDAVLSSLETADHHGVDDKALFYELQKIQERFKPQGHSSDPEFDSDFVKEVADHALSLFTSSRVSKRDVVREMMLLASVYDVDSPEILSLVEAIANDKILRTDLSLISDLTAKLSENSPHRLQLLQGASFNIETDKMYQDAFEKQSAYSQLISMCGDIGPEAALKSQVQQRKEHLSSIPGMADLPPLPDLENLPKPQFS